MGRVRIFAGPNGSGKTTLNTQLKGDFNLGYFLNADDLFEKVEQESFIDFNSFNLAPSSDELKTFFYIMGSTLNCHLAFHSSLSAQGQNLMDLRIHTRWQS